MVLDFFNMKEIILLLGKKKTPHRCPKTINLEAIAEIFNQSITNFIYKLKQINTYVLFENARIPHKSITLEVTLILFSWDLLYFLPVFDSL